jgi:hypothetical protein
MTRVFPVIFISLLLILSCESAKPRVPEPEEHDEEMELKFGVYSVTKLLEEFKLHEP